jgi:hypothetical protein
MDAAERSGEMRRMQARDDADDGVGCGGVARVSSLFGCVGDSVRGCPPPGRRVAVIEPSRDRETSPAAEPASAPLAPGACGPRGSGAGESAEHTALRAFLHHRPRTARCPPASALRGRTGDLPPGGSGCGRRGGRPIEHVDSLRGCESDINHGAV